MKEALLHLLACPECRGALRVARTAAAEGAEVLEGALACGGCGREFPIARGVPRFAGESEGVASFGFEWLRHARVQYDRDGDPRSSRDFFRAKTPWSPESLAGKAVLDGGCGGGRYLDVVSRAGAAAVVGVDLSAAVDAAFELVGRRPNVMVVQGDLFRPPVARERFDLAYSIGVLQHTGDGRRAFAALASAVRPGGELSVWVYEHSRVIEIKDRLFRKTLGRLPRRTLHALARLAARLAPLARLPLAGGFLRALSPPLSLHPDPEWRVLDTFDWLSPAHQAYYRWPEVFGWFRENGFAEIGLSEPGITMFGTKTR